MNYNVATMLFKWDPEKADSNKIKHGVSFEMAQTVFDDPFHLSLLDSKKHEEERWITLGQSIEGLLLVVIHTYFSAELGEVVRLISARKATSKERRNYEEGI